jgi:hypothetical protein
MLMTNSQQAFRDRKNKYVISLEDQIATLMKQQVSLEESNVALEKHVYRLLVQNEALRARAGIPASSVVSYFASIASLKLREKSILGEEELKKLSLLEVPDDGQADPYSAKPNLTRNSSVESCGRWRASSTPPTLQSCAERP